MRPNISYFRVIKEIDAPHQCDVLQGDGLSAGVVYEQRNLPGQSALYSKFNDTIFISGWLGRDFYSQFVKDKLRSIEQKANSDLDQTKKKMQG